MILNTTKVQMAFVFHSLSQCFQFLPNNIFTMIFITTNIVKTTQAYFVLVIYCCVAKKGLQERAML